ncbi:hypothetical protein T265_15045, partial [Opisthorchis viverrini]
MNTVDNAQSLFCLDPKMSSRDELHSLSKYYLLPCLAVAGYNLWPEGVRTVTGEVLNAKNEKRCISVELRYQAVDEDDDDDDDDDDGDDDDNGDDDDDDGDDDDDDDDDDDEDDDDDNDDDDDDDEDDDDENEQPIGGLLVIEGSLSQGTVEQNTSLRKLPPRKSTGGKAPGKQLVTKASARARRRLLISEHYNCLVTGLKLLEIGQAPLIKGANQGRLIK